MPPGSLQSREGVSNKLKVVNRKDINGTLRTHVQGPSGPLPTIDATPYHLNKGNIFTVFSLSVVCYREGSELFS